MSATTFGEMIDQVCDICKVAAPMERLRVKSAVNYAYGDVVQRILTPVKSTSAVALTSANSYSLSAAPFSLTDFIALRSVIYNQSGTGPNNVLRQVTPHEIYQYRNQIWSGYLWAFAIEGTDNLLLAPSPSTGDTLTLVYNYRPAAMATDSDTASLLDDEDVDAVIVGAARRVSRWAQPARTASLAAEYAALVDAAQARQNRKGGSAGMKLRRGRPGRPPHDNSTDVRWGAW